MNTSYFRFSYIVIFISILGGATSANACSCLKKEAADYLSNCQQLFIATLEEVKLESKDGPITKTVGKFSAPSHIIKGSPSVVESIVNTRAGTSCDMYLQVGEEYIVCGNDKAEVTNSMCGYSHSLYGNSKLDLMKKLSVEVSSRHVKQLADSAAQ